MEVCNHCHYNKPLSHFYLHNIWNINNSVYSNYRKINNCINWSNHPNESRCPCYKLFRKTHEYPRTGKDEQMKYHRELQKLIEDCPRSNQNLKHALIKSVKNLKPIISIFERVDLIKEISLDRKNSSIC